MMPLWLVLINYLNSCRYIIGEDFYGDMVKSEDIGDGNIRFNFFISVYQS